MKSSCFASSLVFLMALGTSVGALSQEVATPNGTARTAVVTTGAEPILSARDLLADVVILRRAFETLHPGLYRYNTAEQMDAAFLALRSEFQDDRTLADAYLAFSVFAAKIKCGHTYANFYNQTKAVQEALFRGSRVPFYFRWLGKAMIITKAFTSDPRLKPGTEVLAINGTPVATILERLMTVARADGNNDAKRVAYMEVQGTDRFEAFDIYFPLLFPSSAQQMTLNIRDLNGRRPSEIQVRPLTLEERLSSMKNSGGNTDDARGLGWEFRFLSGRIAYLRMPSWVLYNSKWNWKAFLTESFEAMVKKGATDLVIDLRGNEGGSDVGDEIIGHLIRHDVPRQAVTRRVRYRKVPNELNPFLDTWDDTFRDWGVSALDSADEFYRLHRDADDDIGGVIKPILPTFAGRVWVLVGATNSSATFEFAQAVRQNNLGTLVGQPTGGNQRGINGGAFFFLRLPHSGIELDLPLIGQFPEGDRPDAGLQPEILVIPTTTDIARGRDIEMDTVLTQARRLAKKAK